VSETLNGAQRAHKEGQITDARNTYEKLLEKDPDDLIVHRGLGILLCQIGEYTSSDAHLGRAIEGGINDAEIYNASGIVCLATNRPKLALEHFAVALKLEPGYADVACNLALACLQCNQPKEAILHIRSAFDRDDATRTPNNYYHLVTAHEKLDRLREAYAVCSEGLSEHSDSLTLQVKAAFLAESLNDQDSFVRHLKSALTIDSDDIDVRFLTAILCTRHNNHTAAVEIFEKMELARDGSSHSVRFHFELGSSYDALGKFSQAMHQFQIGNSLIKNMSPGYEAKRDEFMRHVLKERDLLPAQVHAACPFAQSSGNTNNLAFLVGFPRSGTTLLDQMLDSHASIHVLDEMPAFYRTMKQLTPGQSALDTLSVFVPPGRAVELQRKYFREVSRFRKLTSGQYLVDKNPFLITMVRSIHTLFPEAKLILAVRHPCDVVLSNFMQRYEVNAAMANFLDLEDAVTCYDRVMKLWQELETSFPLSIHRVRYEDLVKDYKEEMQRLLAFLGLTWDPAVLDYKNHALTKRVIRTPSYNQVVQDIYTSSVGRWKNYRRWLKPHLPLLEHHIDRLGYSLDQDSPKTEC